MLRRCTRCGSSFEGQKEQRLCPSCREQAAHKPRMISHVCKSCGTTFTGGPRASFCPECKAERDKQAVKKCRNLAKNKTTRQIGSTDICQRCGKPYIVKGGLQKYCPECAPISLKEKTEPLKRAWAANYREQNPDHKKTMQKNGTICVVCGKTFAAVDRSNACSPECLAILKKQQQYHKDIKRGRYKKLSNTKGEPS